MVILNCDLSWVILNFNKTSTVLGKTKIVGVFNLDRYSNFANN